VNTGAVIPRIIKLFQSIISMKRLVFPPAANASGEDFGDGVNSGMVVGMLNHFLPPYGRHTERETRITEQKSGVPENARK
jgi:hypothetical protein